MHLKNNKISTDGVPQTVLERASLRLLYLTQNTNSEYYDDEQEQQQQQQTIRALKHAIDHAYAARALKAVLESNLAMLQESFKQVGRVHSDGKLK